MTTVNLVYGLPLDIQEKIFGFVDELLEYDEWVQYQEDLWDNEQENVDDMIRQTGFYCMRCRYGSCDEH
jgi:hypothetical protein